MGMQLPGELVSVLSMLGYTWPKADEEKLYELSQSWMTFSGVLRTHVSEADSAAAIAWQGNFADTITAFQTKWQADTSPSARLANSATGAQIVGAALMVAAGIVLALKISVIAQLIILAIQIAQAVATAVVTFGASLLEIPIFKMITGAILDKLIDMALNAVLNG